VNVPALSAGIHSIQVEKGSVRSVLNTLTVVAPATITSAKLASGVLTITGTGFGANALQFVTINKADGSIIPSDSITSWSDTQIVATSAAAAVGDTVTVTTTEGSGTATIEEGTVAPSITVTSPNGGENWKRSTTQTITWASVGNPGDNVKIEYLKGTTVKVIVKNTLNDGSFDWAIPKTQPLGTDYKIRITSTTNPQYTDTSDNNFQISK
jgi:ribosomal protein L14